MCGICCILNVTNQQRSRLLDLEYITSNSFISNRGPDAQRSIQQKLWSKVSSLFTGFVLHLRGSLTSQPISNEKGDILLWNGEIFGGLQVGEDENDTHVLLQKLDDCGTHVEILAVFQSIQGPWSFIYWQAQNETLWFGRDVFGRRSLLWHLPQSKDDVFALSSVVIRPLEFHEVPSVGLFCITMDISSSCELSESNLPSLLLHLFPWKESLWPGTRDPVAVSSPGVFAEKCNIKTHIAVRLHQDEPLESWMPSLNKQIPDDSCLFGISEKVFESSNLCEMIEAIERKSPGIVTAASLLLNALEKAVKTRVNNLPRPHRHYNEAANNAGRLKPVSGFEPNDGGSCKDCLKKYLSYTSLMDTGQNHGQTNESKTTMTGENADATRVSNTNKFKCSCTMLTRTHDINALCNVSGDFVPENKPAHVAILFSGGIDSTVIAVLADRCLPYCESIDLINVAFEQKPFKTSTRQNKPNSSHIAQDVSHFNVPDRQTGYQALSDLNPNRQWNFVEVNVTQDELHCLRSQHVRHLVYPLNTVLDDSIGCAVWFAARGRGILGNGPNTGQSYISTARVILCGMGADEQLAGYSRHRICFKQHSWSGLVAEIDMEINRISTRNLGRDDRVITDHGKESRFPFLDEEVVSFLSSLPIHHKADLRLPRGVGEKLLLRVAARQLGLMNTATLPKRAIQFGSRIAKMEQKSEKGNHVCQRLQDD